MLDLIHIPPFQNTLGYQEIFGTANVAGANRMQICKPRGARMLYILGVGAGGGGGGAALTANTAGAGGRGGCAYFLFVWM